MKSLPDVLREKSPDHHTRYLYIKQLARSNFQEYATLVGSLTNHGPRHYQNLENNLDRLLPDNLKDQLADEEIFLLLCAVHFHDVGLLSEKYTDEPWTDVRKDHVNRTYDYIHDYYQQWELNTFEALALKNICLGHSGNTLDELLKEIVIHNAKIRIQFLAALLRIADELDLDYTRVSSTIMDLKKFPEESLKHWEKHRGISGVWIDSESWTIEVSAMPETEESKAIIEELVGRKVQGELNYVSPIFKKYHLYYRQVIVNYMDFGNKRSASNPPAQSKQDAQSSNGSSQTQIATPTQKVNEAQQEPPVEQELPQDVSPSMLSLLDQQDDETTANNLTRFLIQCSLSVFEAVIAYYRPPSGVGETGTRANRTRELVTTAVGRGDLFKLINACYDALGITPLEKKKFRTD